MNPVPVGYYDRRTSYRSVRAADLRQAADVFDLHPARVLDLGCGDGRIVDVFPSALVLGVDYSPARIAKAQARSGVWVQADMAAFLDVCTVSADLVTICEVLEHVADPAGLVARARRIAPVLATVPVDMPDPAHVHVWSTEEEMRADLRPDRVVRVRRRWVCWWAGE